MVFPWQCSRREQCLVDATLASCRTEPVRRGSTHGIPYAIRLTAGIAELQLIKLRSSPRFEGHLWLLPVRSLSVGVMPPGHLYCAQPFAHFHVGRGALHALLRSCTHQPLQWAHTAQGSVRPWAAPGSPAVPDDSGPSHHHTSIAITLRALHAQASHAQFIHTDSAAFTTRTCCAKYCV